MSSFRTARLVIAGVLAMALVALFGATTANAAPAAPVAPTAATTPLTGTFTDAAGGTGTATGTFTPTQFVAQGDQLVAEGVTDLTLVDSTGQTVGTESQTVRVPVDLGAAQASCEILDLVLGPLDLDLLGLVVHLDRMHLNITAGGRERSRQPAGQPAVRGRRPARRAVVRPERADRTAQRDPGRPGWPLVPA